MGLFSKLICYITALVVIEIAIVSIYWSKMMPRGLIHSGDWRIRAYMEAEQTHQDTKIRSDEALEYTYEASVLEDDTSTTTFPVELTENGTKKRILVYRYSGGYWNSYITQVNFSLCEKYRNCYIERIKRKDESQNFTYTPVPADALIFQGNAMVKEFPLRRDPDQVFIYFDMECPWYIHNGRQMHEPWKSSFNWTMSYRVDSDFYTPYHVTFERSQEDSIKDYSEIYRQKTKSVLWFVGHCRTTSRRELYVEELKKYIDVDIFGVCAERMVNCGFYSRLRCLENATKPYKFYISFENNFCKDYVTEKYYYYLNYDIIPVVRGGANYSALVPPNTYINTADFESPKHLAAYLKRLGDSEEEYTNFLKKKNKYEAKYIPYESAFCSICERLNNIDKYRKTYSDIGNWWGKGKCHHPTDLNFTLSSS